MREIRNCNVAVIGGAGFLGSHLVEHLIEDRKCNVLVLDNLITGRREFIHPGAKFLWCDITHSEHALMKIFKVYDVDYVFNYAAEPYVPVSYDRPLHVFDVNARGALMVLNAAQDAKVKGILQVSSAEIYGNITGRIRETDATKSHSTYGASKLAIDHLIQARNKESGLQAIALRQFNCLGERETHPYVIPEIIYQVAQSHTISLGNNSYRDFIYAKDAVMCAVLLLEKGTFGEVYNLGSESGIQIYDLANKIAGLMGKEITIQTEAKRQRPWEIWHLQSDNSKIHSVIGIQPLASLDIALIKVIEDFKKRGFFFYD